MPSPSPQKLSVEAALAEHPFVPPWWARRGLVQTALASVPATVERAPSVRRLDTPDGDFVRLHEWPGPDGAPLVLLLHGLEGGAPSRYVGEFVRRARDFGWSLCLLEFRSCGDEPNRTARFYHSGETTDLAFVVQHLVARAPERAMFACGYSLGGNVLAKWLGEVGSRAPTARCRRRVGPIRSWGGGTTMRCAVGRSDRTTLLAHAGAQDLGDGSALSWDGRCRGRSTMPQLCRV